MAKTYRDVAIEDMLGTVEEAFEDDYRRTHHVLEMLKPDIWLAQHNEYLQPGRQG